MSPDSPLPPEPDPLQTLLEDAESELRSKLQEACESEAKGVSTESTEEIRRLEDKLLAAASAAKQTIAVRHEMKRRGPAKRERPMRIEAADRETGNAPGKGKSGRETANWTDRSVMGVREFTDIRGQPWRAWVVVPGQTRASSGGRQFLGDFQDGWICFESLGASARRRLPFHRTSWADISDEELPRLLEQAIDAPIRDRKQGGTRPDR